MTAPTDARILRGYLDARGSNPGTIDDCCRVLGWTVARYMSALSALYASKKG